MGKHLKLTAFILALVLNGAGYAEDLRNIDVSGRKGPDGQDGQNRSGSASTNSDGANGGHAGPATAGQHSGNIDVTFKSGPDGKLILEGTYAPAGDSSKQVRETITIGKKGYIPLRANGGAGGRGGDGGEGQDGGRGSDGSDATRYSSGSNGHRGGDGGDGGNATSGERGGNGGKINVRVTGDDTHLLMLALPEVRGGKGGRAGVNGSGGSGGRGGSGGSSYSWTESHTTTSTGSDGKTTTQTHTTYHSNPGGSDGSSGSRGRDGNASVRDGADAPDGQYKIIVNDGNGKTREYKDRYDMSIVGFQMLNDNGDKINEPGEKATIQKLRVKNTGGMPTPPNHPVTVYLGSSEWVVPDGVELKVPKSLAPGEEYIFEKEVLPFKIPDTKIVEKDKPFERGDAVRPLSYQAEVNRPFTNFDKPHQFTIEFPIKIEPVHAIETLAPGDAAKMEWKVTNISGRDFGGATDLKREIATRLGMGNHGEMGKSVVLMDSAGNPLDWNKGLLQEIATLKAGQSTTVTGMMGILPGAESYSSANMELDLQLGQIEQPGTRKAIQKNTYPVRVGEKYQKTKDSDILLVTNHGTTKEEIQAWRELAKRSGKTIDVWDISLNNFLDLDRSVIKGENLMEDFHGKTIVLLNNAFKTVDGQKHGDELMGQMDLIRATASHGIRLLVVNEANHEIYGLMSDRLIPTDKEVEHGYKDLKTYLRGEPDASSEKGSALIVKEKFKPEVTGVEEKRAEVKINPTDTTGQISIDGYRKPNEKRLAAQAAAAQLKIEQRNPGARVVVSYDVAEPGAAGPEFAKTKGWFGKYQHQGVLTVRPTVNDMQPNITVVNVSPKMLHDADFIGGEGMNAALTQSFNFEDKLTALDKVLAELHETPEGDPQFEARQALGKKLVDGILVDLAVEQAAVLRPGWKAGVSADTLRKSMEYLNRIGTYQTSLDLSKASAATDLMADLVAGIQFLGKNQARWYERLPMPWGPFRRGPVVSNHTAKMAEQLRTQMFGPISSNSEALKTRLKSRLEELTKRRNELYAEHRKGSKDDRLTVKQSAVEAVLEPLKEGNATMDAMYTFNRVLAEGEWKAIHDNETAIEDGRRELQIAKEKQKGDYLVVSEGQVTDPAHAACAANFMALVKTARETVAAVARK